MWQQKSKESCNRRKIIITMQQIYIYGIGCYHEDTERKKVIVLWLGAIIQLQCGLFIFDRYGMFY